MRVASTDDFRLDRQSVGRDILAVSVGKVAGLHSRQVSIDEASFITVLLYRGFFVSSMRLALSQYRCIGDFSFSRVKPDARSAK